MKEKLSYFLRSLFNLGQQKKCPYCGNKTFKHIDRKYLITTLLLCEQCYLMHRHPKDDAGWLRKFYQSDYSIPDHMVTKLPDDQTIEQLKKENFPSLRSFDPYLRAIVPDGSTVIDYGCSWGYNIFKLKTSGYKAMGFEISAPRARFGREKLDVEIHDDAGSLPKEVDVVLSSHVIEHLSDIEEFFSTAKSVLKEEGILMCFCPNGNDTYRQREPNTWHINWGGLHPNYLSTAFYQYAFAGNPYLILTGDWLFNPDDIRNWDGKSQQMGNIQNGKELLIIVKPNTNSLK